MLIKNQTGTSLINFNNIISVDIDDDGAIKVYYPISCSNGWRHECIGIYKSEQRAKDVLNGIIKAFVNDYQIYFMPEK